METYFKLVKSSSYNCHGVVHHYYFTRAPDTGEGVPMKVVDLADALRFRDDDRFQECNKKGEPVNKPADFGKPAPGRHPRTFHVFSQSPLAKAMEGKRESPQKGNLEDGEKAKAEADAKAAEEKAQADAKEKAEADAKAAEEADAEAKKKAAAKKKKTDKKPAK